MNYLSKILPLKISHIFILALLISVFSTSKAAAQSSAQVYLQPVESADGTLTVEVLAENVAEMYGAEVRLKYDPAVLAVQDSDPQQAGVQIQAGDLLPVDQGFVVANQANETEGTITYALTLLNPAPPVNGTGTLARVTFDVLQSGPATIDIEKAKLVAVDLQTIASEAIPLVLNNETQAETAAQPAPSSASTDVTTGAAGTNAEPSPATIEGSDFPWWIVAVGVIVVGVVALGAFAVLGGKNQSQRAARSHRPRSTASQTTRPADQHAESQSRTRPSAFK